MVGMTPRRRLDPAARRSELVDVGSRFFAEAPYDAVQMDEVARRAGVSRALLYRHFSSKRDLFAAVYRRAADRLLDEVEIDPTGPLADQVAAGLDTHLDYFVANRFAVLAANRTLAGDPVIQAVVADELGELRRRVLDAMDVTGTARAAASAALMSWLEFVRVLCVEWLANEAFSRAELRDICLGALWGALGSITPDGTGATPTNPAR